MPIQEGAHDVRLVAIGFGVLFLTHEVAQHRLSNFWIGFICKSVTQHGWRCGHVEQAQPATHGAERAGYVVISLKGNGLETGWDWHFSFDGLLQELLIEALDSGEYGKFPLGIFSQLVFPQRNGCKMKVCQTQRLRGSYLGKPAVAGGFCMLNSVENVDHR